MRIKGIYLHNDLLITGSFLQFVCTENLKNYQFYLFVVQKKPHCGSKCLSGEDVRSASLKKGNDYMKKLKCGGRISTTFRFNIYIFQIKECCNLPIILQYQ